MGLFCESFLSYLSSEQISILIALVAAVVLLVIFAHQTIEIGWNGRHPVLRLRKKEGLTMEQVDRRIRDEFARYISGLDAYNHDISRHDQAARVLITHKLDEITFPKLASLDEDRRELMRRSVLYTLLVMNMENHYVDASQTQEKLTIYLADKFKKIVSAVHPFLESWTECYIVSYDILSQWWAVVGSAIHSKTLTDLETDYTRVDMLQDPTWKRRIETTIARHKKSVANIEKMSSVRPAVLRYFSEEHYAVPDFLND